MLGLTLFERHSCSLKHVSLWMCLCMLVYAAWEFNLVRMEGEGGSDAAEKCLLSEFF